MAVSPTSLRQRADLTFKHNRHHGRHGWLRLTPAYSVRLVEAILDDFGESAATVFDPFCGTGTTALCAAYRGRHGLTTDINPFLVWLASAKAKSYTRATASRFERVARTVLRTASTAEGCAADTPALSNIERWWRPTALEFLLSLKGAIDSCERTNVDVETLLQLAFCRTMMALSNAAFNHQSMSFKPESAVQDALELGDESQAFGGQFLKDVYHVAVPAADNPDGTTEILLGDARKPYAMPGLSKWKGKVDLLITSPPYPNRMSYIRELRPYMYWLNFLKEARHAGELDWEAIGGTWGIATSRLMEWAPAGEFEPTGMSAAVSAIRAAHQKNGPLLANYVHKYFEDMFVHLRLTIGLLASGATAHYIIGNSIFYGHMVAAERYLADQMTAVGFERVEIVPIRKRNSKKGLVEFRVSGTKV